MTRLGTLHLMEPTNRELSVNLAALIAALPEEERAILTLHYVSGCSIAEIASVLSVPERVVERVLAAGKARLVTALGMG